MKLKLALDLTIRFANPLSITLQTAPAAAAALTGARSFVTDSNAAMTAGIGAIVAGGGANKVPVYCDGANWRIG